MYSDKRHCAIILILKYIKRKEHHYNKILILKALSNDRDINLYFAVVVFIEQT